jgi:hypothetical protein
MDRESVAVMMETKSVALGIILALFFGGLAVFYVSIAGGIIMGIITAIAWFITFVTFGFGGIVMIPLVHGIALIWVIVGVNNHNKRLAGSLKTEKAQPTPHSDGGESKVIEASSISIAPPLQTPVRKNKFCTKCGTAIDPEPGGFYCTECGNPLS